MISITKISDKKFIMSIAPHGSFKIPMEGMSLEHEGVRYIIEKVEPIEDQALSYEITVK